MNRNVELQQQIRDLQPLPGHEPGAGLGLRIPGPIDGPSFSPGADSLEEEEEEGGPSTVSAPVDHGEEGEETYRRTNAAPTADAQLASEIENLNERLTAAVARNNEFERRGEEDRMENKELAAEKLQNLDLARENDERTRVGNELTRQNDELRKKKR
jgi:hypothetical protein